jgi:hypothetical protein
MDHVLVVRGVKCTGKIEVGYERGAFCSANAFYEVLEDLGLARAAPPRSKSLLRGSEQVVLLSQSPDAVFHKGSEQLVDGVKESNGPIST